MPARSGRSGLGNKSATRIPGASSKPTTEQSLAHLLADVGAGDLSELPFLRGHDAERSAFRSPERKSFLEGSRYVGHWGPWRTPEGDVRRVDYGCFAWLHECCRTFIEAQEIGANPIALLPQLDEHGGEYFRVLCHTAARWQTERLLFIDKSRRMIMSWLLRCLDTWDALFHTGRRLYVMSEDLEKSEELVYRGKFLYDHVPSERIPRNILPPVATVTAQSKANRGDILNRLTIQHSQHEAGALDSFVQGVPQGDDLRQLGAARVTIEEAQIQKKLEKNLPGLLGTMQGRPGPDGAYTGGQIVLIGTPDALSYAAEIIADKIGRE